MRIPSPLPPSLLLLVIVLVPTLACARPANPKHALTFAPSTPVTLAHIIDGDTAWFRLPDSRLVKGRFADINTPECHKRQVNKRDGFRSATCERDDEYYGTASRDALAALLQQGPLRLDCVRKRGGDCAIGGNGRPLVRVSVGGRDAALSLVEAGAAWTFTKYPSDRRDLLCRAEARARAGRRGMWAREWAEISARMQPKTRAWYAQHDHLCRKAGGGR